MHNLVSLDTFSSHFQLVKNYPIYMVKKLFQTLFLRIVLFEISNLIASVFRGKGCKFWSNRMIDVYLIERNNPIDRLNNNLILFLSISSFLNLKKLSFNRENFERRERTLQAWSKFRFIKLYMHARGIRLGFWVFHRECWLGCLTLTGNCWQWVSWTNTDEQRWIKLDGSRIEPRLRNWIVASYE